MSWLPFFVIACIAGACWCFYRAGFDAGAALVVAEWRWQRSHPEDQTIGLETEQVIRKAGGTG